MLSTGFYTAQVANYFDEMTELQACILIKMLNL